MAKTIQTISECRKLTEKINKQVNEKEYPMSAELGSVVLPKIYVNEQVRKANEGT